MADTVNQTHRDRLAQRDSEPSHIAGKAPYTDIGGKGVNDEANTVKVDAANGVGTDTSIPKSVGAEKTHLKTATASGVDVSEDKDDDDVDVKFDGDIEESDDLDKELDQFEDVDPVEVDIDVDADDKEKVDEDTDDDSDDKLPAFLKKKEVDEEDENPFAKKDDDSDDLKEDDERGDNNGKTQASVDAMKAEVGKGTNNELPEEDENPFAKKDDEKIEEDENPFAKKDGDDDDKEKKENPFAESVKIRIKLPNAKLFESAGVPKKNQRRVGLVFESVVKNVTKQISTQVVAHYKKLHEQKLAKRDAVLGKQMDSYLNYVVEEWVKSNKVAIRTSLRSQLAEEFLTGLQRLFTEHYIDVPESKVDVVKQLSKQVSTLKKSLSEQTAQKMKLRRLAESANKARIVAQFARNHKLSEAQCVKMEKLSEGVAYTTGKEFREKLAMLSESYFPTTEKKELKHLPEETVVEPKVAPKAEPTSHDPLIAATLAASKAMNDRGAW